MPDYAERRRIMVDTQVRPSDVTKYPIIDAMLAVPREHHVPDDLREAAYIGEHLELAQGRVMLDPRTLAKMLDALDIGRDDLVLDIGCGLGYSTAVAARLAEAVVGLEEVEPLAREAEAILAADGVDNAVVVPGPLAEGSPRHGAFDAIIVQGGVEELPQALAAQLKDGGRIVCLFMENALGVCRVGLKTQGQLSWRDVFNGSAPVLPGFEREREFSL